MRPFDPNLTGKYDYDGRAELQKGLPVNFGGVELPKSMGSSLNRVYSPESIHFEGYSQFPKPLAMPYTNEKLLLSQDGVAKKRSRETLHFMKTMRDTFQAKWNKKLVTHVAEDFNFQKNNVGASFLTSPVNYTKQEDIKYLVKNHRDAIMGDISGYKSKYQKKTNAFT